MYSFSITFLTCSDLPFHVKINNKQTIASVFMPGNAFSDGTVMWTDFFADQIMIYK
jgi:hypothetical protein